MGELRPSVGAGAGVQDHAAVAEGIAVRHAAFLGNYTATRKDLVETANDLFDVVSSGKVKIAVNQTYPLAEAARRACAISRRGATTGSTLLLP